MPKSEYDKKREQHIFDGRPQPEKKKYTIQKKSVKKQAAEAAEKQKRAGGPTDLERWFRMQIRFMSICEETKVPLVTTPYHKAINSVCHILSQQQCESVKTHPLNRVFLEENLHKKFDAMSWEERQKMKCWPVIQARLIMIYPDLAPEEHRHFPESVLKIIEQQNPFT